MGNHLVSEHFDWLVSEDGNSVSTYRKLGLGLAAQTCQSTFLQGAFPNNLFLRSIYYVLLHNRFLLQGHMDYARMHFGLTATQWNLAINPFRKRYYRLYIIVLQAYLSLLKINVLNFRPTVSLAIKSLQVLLATSAGHEWSCSNLCKAPLGLLAIMRPA